LSGWREIGAGGLLARIGIRYLKEQRNRNSAKNGVLY